MSMNNIHVLYHSDPFRSSRLDLAMTPKAPLKRNKTMAPVGTVINSIHAIDGSFNTIEKDAKTHPKTHPRIIMIPLSIFSSRELSSNFQFLSVISVLYSSTSNP